MGGTRCCVLLSRLRLLHFSLAVTVAQMKKRYLDKLPPLRGVHPKDHGCMMAKFQVLNDLPEAYRIGVFANVEDYEVLSQVLLEEDDKAAGFFKRRIKIENGKPDLAFHRMLP